MITADSFSLGSLLAFAATLFMLAVAIGIALAFPNWIDAVRAAISQATSRTFAGFSALTRTLKRGSDELRFQGSTHTRHWFGLARHNRLLLGITGFGLITPVILALAFQKHAGVDYFDDVARPADPVVLALLQGEQLTPPAPLPPEVFSTPELEIIRPAIGSANRDWKLLDTDFRQRLLVVLETMRRHGYDLALLEGYRSPARQDYLAGLGPDITHVGAFQSYHQFGLAADCAFYLGGRIIIDERDPWAMRGYKLLGEISESVGLTWGGRWKMMDFGHIELRRAGVLAHGR